MDMIYPVIERRCDARVEELRAEFGMIVADRIIESEAVDFLWEARVRERYLGDHVDVDGAGADGSAELSRVLVLSCLARVWCVALCLVDGEGTAVDLLWKQSFEDRMAAEIEFAAAQ